MHHGFFPLLTCASAPGIWTTVNAATKAKLESIKRRIVISWCKASPMSCIGTAIKDHE
jgi:hypothetical protein